MKISRKYRLIEKLSSVTKKDIHRLADRKGIPWDDDPKFKAWSKRITGSSCLDEMTPAQLSKLKRALSAKTKIAAEGGKDVYVYTALPKGARELVDRYGLMSAKNVVKTPEVLAAARSPEEREKFKATIKRKAGTWQDDSVSGPSVFFGPPDWDKIHEKHYITKWDLQPSRINLSKLMRDEPGTRISGSELVPYDPAWRKLSDKEYDALGIKRHRDLTLEEVREYAKKSPKEIWKHYDSPEGTHYASDVPHAMVITPSGNISPKYIEHLDNWEGKKSTSGVIAHIAGPSGSGKTTILERIKEKHPNIVTKDLDEIDDVAKAELGITGRKRNWSDEKLTKFYAKKQEVLDRFLAENKGKDIVLAGHHMAAGPPELAEAWSLKIPGRKILLNTGAKKSALRRSQRGDHPGTENIPKYRVEAKKDIKELTARGYRKKSPKKIMRMVKVKAHTRELPSGKTIKVKSHSRDPTK